MNSRTITIDYFGTELEFTSSVGFTIFAVCKDKSKRIYAYDAIPKASNYEWVADWREIILLGVATDYLKDSEINKVPWKQSLKYYSLLENGSSKEITEEEFILLKEICYG